MKAFGIGEDVGVEGFSRASSLVPTPEWKEDTFEDGTWRLGDTYLTAIGQYGFQVTPLHMARGIAAIANNGYLVSPTLAARQTNASSKVDINISDDYYSLVRRGMRESVLSGTAKSMNVPGVTVSAKTGTAEIGISKKLVNSWVVGYFPADTRQYTFALVMERAPRSNTFGATLAMRELLEWMVVEKPEYLTSKKD
jgi:penicillin-binding protein 2